MNIDEIKFHQQVRDSTGDVGIVQGAIFTGGGPPKVLVSFKKKYSLTDGRFVKVAGKIGGIWHLLAYLPEDLEPG